MPRALEELQQKASAQVLVIEEKFRSSATRGDLFADAVSNTVGSWKFIIIQSIVLAAWLIFMSVAPEKWRIDPFPFMALNLLLSFQAAYTAPFIMMSQNRSSAKDRTYAETDFVTNQLAQSEIDEMHEHLDEIIETVRDSRELLRESATIRQYLADITERLERLEQRLSK